jgi:hypothetical protein
MRRYHDTFTRLARVFKAAIFTGHPINEWLCNHKAATNYLLLKYTENYMASVAYDSLFILLRVE